MILTFQKLVEVNLLPAVYGWVCYHPCESACNRTATDSQVSIHAIDPNIEFAAENDWISAIGSFYSEKPCTLYIEAMGSSVILQIKKPHLIYLYTNYPKFDRKFRVIIENKYSETQNRPLQNISSNAEERYKAF